MNTILYPIPAKYFPAVKVITPFHAKVNYKVVAGKVFIEDIALSAKCMEHMRDQNLFIREAKEVLQKVEDKTIKDDNVHPVMMKAIAPHINY
jgi:hypothetical protein